MHRRPRQQGCIARPPPDLERTAAGGGIERGHRLGEVGVLPVDEVAAEHHAEAPRLVEGEAEIGLGGGSLVIERTEALTAVDVNGGERGTPLAVNLEAARELARQLRLRNIGGVVVVDFISMKAPAEGEQVVQTLSGAVAGDPAGTQVYGMSRLGLVELTRARRGPALAEVLARAGTAPT